MEMENMESEYKCGRAEDIIAYIYNEIEPPKREEFEAHIAGCMSCTDEFAAVSDARFSVFEWHKEEFSNLLTPQFVVPELAAARSTAGFFSPIGDLIRGLGWPAAVAASITILVGITVGIMSFTSRSDDRVAGVESEIPVVLTAPTAVTEISSADKELMGNTVLTEAEGISKTIGNNIAPLRTVKKNTSVRVVSTATTKDRGPRFVKPVLSSYEDIEDRTLRLSDLMDEVEG